MENIHDIIIVSRNITSNRISVQHWPISDLCEQSRYIVIKLPDISFFFFFTFLIRRRARGYFPPH